MAMAGHHDAAKILAKDVSKNRIMRKQYLMMGSQLKSIEMQLNSMQMNQAVMQGLKGASGVMAQMNKDMNVSEIKDVLKEFNKEMMKADMNGEMMADSMEMMEGAEVAGNAEELYEGILGDIGLEYVQGQAAVSKDQIKVAAEEQKEEVGASDDLEARLAALRM